MKYVLLLLVIHTAINAHCQCNEFDNLIKKGDNFLRGNQLNYQEAINAYTAAILACWERAEEAKKRITKMVNDINELKVSAVAAEKKSTEAQRKAESALAELESALADIRVKNLATFETFASLGANLIYTLDYTEALEKMKVAIDIEVDPNIKKQLLTEPLAELLYFFGESGRRPAMARTAAELLLRLNPEAELDQALQQCIQEGWNTRSQFAPLLQKLPYFSKFQARYYPELVSVPLGMDSIFEMGSDPVEWKRQSNEQLHKVKLSAYQIAVTPTTFYQFAMFSESTERGLINRTPYWGRFGDHPVVSVNWYEGPEYANWLNVRQGRTPVYEITKINDRDPKNQVETDYLKWNVEWKNQAKGFRLPTEAEWELAARAGVGAPRTLFAGSDTLETVGWFWENSGDKPLSGDWDLNRVYDNNGRTQPVKQKKDNGIGIYDMSGNVYEWCWDRYSADYYDECHRWGVVQDPTGPKSSTDGRVIRGGGWYRSAEHCRVASRFTFPGGRSGRIGFRLVFVP